MFRRLQTPLVFKTMMIAALLVPLMAAECDDDGGDFSSGDIIDIIFAVADAIIRIIAFAG